MQEPVEITGIRLLSPGKNYMEVSVEIDGQWVSVIKEYWVQDGVTSHIVEPLGIREAVKRQKRNPE